MTRLKPIRTRVIIPTIRSESEFSDWCAAATTAAESGESSVGKVTQPIYLLDSRDYAFGSELNPLPFFRLTCEGTGRFEWPGDLIETSSNAGRILPYAVRGYFDRCEFTKYESRGSCVKPFYTQMTELIFKDCYYHDCGNLVGSNGDHHSAMCQFDIDAIPPSLRFECDGLTATNNNLNNSQYAHDLYVDAFEVVVTNCTFTNSGGLKLQTDNANPSVATCEVAYNTWIHDNPGVTQWWAWLTETTGEWRTYHYSILFKYKGSWHVHNNSFQGWFQEAYNGYWVGDGFTPSNFHDNSYNLTLPNELRFARQLGSQTWHTDTYWRDTLGFDTSGSTFNISAI